MYFTYMGLLDGVYSTFAVYSCIDFFFCQYLNFTRVSRVQARISLEIRLEIQLFKKKKKKTNSKDKHINKFNIQ